MQCFAPEGRGGAKVIFFLKDCVMNELAILIQKKEWNISPHGLSIEFRKWATSKKNVTLLLLYKDTWSSSNTIRRREWLDRLSWWALATFHSPYCGTERFDSYESLVMLHKLWTLKKVYQKICKLYLKLEFLDHRNDVSSNWLEFAPKRTTIRKPLTVRLLARSSLRLRLLPLNHHRIRVYLITNTRLGDNFAYIVTSRCPRAGHDRRIMAAIREKMT